MDWDGCRPEEGFQLIIWKSFANCSYTRLKGFLVCVTVEALISLVLELY